MAIRITNENKKFPVAFSFCPGENQKSYTFLFDCLRAEIFTNGILEPGVILANQAASILSSIDTHGSAPQSKFQICNWHAIKAMMTRFATRNCSTARIYVYFYLIKGTRTICRALAIRLLRLIPTKADNRVQRTWHNPLSGLAQPVTVRPGYRR
jgi:MULE transposase domain